MDGFVERGPFVFSPLIVGVIGNSGGATLRGYRADQVTPPAPGDASASFSGKHFSLRPKRKRRPSDATTVLSLGVTPKRKARETSSGRSPSLQPEKTPGNVSGQCVCLEFCARTVQLRQRR